ncbi:25050_t:CDS:2, partial [Gigaspora rosea]
QLQYRIKLKHDGSWKEPDEKLSEIVSGILHTLNDAWNNPAFSPKFAKLQSEVQNFKVLPVQINKVKDEEDSLILYLW